MVSYMAVLATAIERNDSMSNNSRLENMSEMERIQRGLEAFLEQELKETQNEETTSQHRKMQGGKSAPQHRKIQGDESGQQVYNLQENKSVPQPYNLWDEEEYEEEDETEDWDSPMHQKRMEERRQLEKQIKHNQKQSRRDKEEQEKRATRTIHSRSTPHKYRGNNKSGKDSKPGKTKKRKKKSGLMRFLIIVLLLLVLLAGGLYYVVGKVYDKLNYDEIESLVSDPIRDEGIINVLLIGNDSRSNGEDGRSDAMILVSINHQTQKIYMTSLLRDMYVEIPGYKNNRLNAAYSFGGAELLMETVEENFDINVNRYVQVNFEAFANLVDAVGGIDLELTTEEIEYVNGYLVEYNMLTDRPQGTDNMDPSASGMVHLNGPQALAYTRNRYIGTDFGRTERQRKVLEAVIKKLPKALISNPKELFNGLLPNLTTNLTKNECYGLSLTAVRYLGYDIVQSSIPMEGTYKNATIRDMSVLEVDFEANRQFLRDTVYADELNE